MKGQRGLSLLETIFAFVLVGFSVIFVFQLLPSSVVAVRRGEEQLQAENLARTFVEEARSAPFQTLSLGSTALTAPEPFSVEREIYSVSGADPAHLLGIRVRVQWSARGRSYELVREVWVSHVRS